VGQYHVVPHGRERVLFTRCEFARLISLSALTYLSLELIRRPVSKAVLASTAIGKADKLPRDGSCRTGEAIPRHRMGTCGGVAFYRAHAYSRLWTFQNQLAAALASARSASSESCLRLYIAVYSLAGRTKSLDMQTLSVPTLYIDPTPRKRRQET
jgi:hypothetical protein